ncbi:MAG: 3-phosphoshikimate 1-carboxyvinyltransferase [Chitinispirillaceae bacterium]|nr:3-phosphoshikimate 1-carboxyvinyltransferase [Chitinispirillaceae bacterium]
MKLIVRPSQLKGSITIPSSKSHTIRALLIGTLASGTSYIRKPLLTGDGASALGAARSLGAKTAFSGDSLAITGRGGDYNSGSDFFDMGNSGTGTNLFTSAAALGSRKRRFDGDNSLRSRPFKYLLDALVPLGALYERERKNGDLPFTISGPLKGGTSTVNGVSSQYVSSLLFSCPLIKGGDTDFTVVNLQEVPYVRLSLWWLEKQGIRLEHNADYTKFHIRGNQSYKPFDMTVPADFSSATFAAAGAALTGGPVTLHGLDFTDPQGDKGVFDLLKMTGAAVTHGGDGVTVSADRTLKAAVMDLNSMPDSLPAVSVLACTLDGETRIVNVGHARIKETDRIVVMREELTKMGAAVTETADGLIIRKSELHGAAVRGRDDHRVVMALALAGCVARGETIIDTAEAAAVTYPSFVDDFRALGADIKVVEE